MEKIRWPALAAAAGLLFSSPAPCPLLQFVPHHACLLLLKVSCTLCCRHNLAYSFISLSPDNLAPFVSPTLFDSPSGCTSTSALPPKRSMVTPFTPSAARYTSQAHTPIKSCQLPESLHSKTMVAVKARVTHSHCCPLFLHIPGGAFLILYAWKYFHI